MAIVGIKGERVQAYVYTPNFVCVRSLCRPWEETPPPKLTFFRLHCCVLAPSTAAKKTKVNVGVQVGLQLNFPVSKDHKKLCCMDRATRGAVILSTVNCQNKSK